MIEQNFPAVGERSELSRGRMAVLTLFLALLMGNLQPLAGQIYAQFLLMAGLLSLYCLAALFSLRLWKVTKGMAIGICIIFTGYVLSSLTYGLNIQSLGGMAKYTLAVASIPMFLSLFSGASQLAKNRLLHFYAAVVLIFTLATEWNALSTWAKPGLQFLGGYNGANLHFLVLATFFLIQSLFAAGTKFQRIIRMVPACLFFILVASTQSRQSVLLASFMLAFIFMAMHKQGRIKFSNAIPLLIVPIGFLAVALLGGIFQRFVIEADGFAENRPISSVERFLMLVQFWEGLDWQRFCIGFGYDAVVRKIEGTADSIHLGYLQLLFNGGVILFVGFGTFFLSAILRFSNPGGPRRILIYTFLAANLFDSHVFSFQVLWLPAIILVLFPDEFPYPHDLPSAQQRRIFPNLQG
jgi:hypothetical protein